MISKYIEDRKQRDPEFADGYDTGYEDFKDRATLIISDETDGRSVHDRLAANIEKGRVTVLKLRDAIKGSSFWFDALGRLYETFRGDKIRACVKTEGMSEPDKEMIKRVTEASSKYYADKK